MDYTALKKKLSPDLLDKCTPLLKKYRHLYNLRDTKDSILYLVDKDGSSDLHFKVIREIHENGRLIEFRVAPGDTYKRAAVLTSTTVDSFLKHLEKWFNNLELYDQNDAFEDPIISGYQEEFNSFFNMVPEDDDRAFPIKVQYLLEEYLETVSDGIEEILPQEEQFLVADIKTEISEIKSNLHVESKKKVIKRLTHLLAKTYKYSKIGAKYFLIEFAKKFADKTITGTIDFLSKHHEQITNYITGGSIGHGGT